MADLTISSTSYQKGMTPAFADDSYNQYGPIRAGEALLAGDIVAFLAGTNGTRAWKADAGVATIMVPRGIIPTATAVDVAVTVYHNIRAAGILGGADMGGIWLSNTAGKMADADPGGGEVQTITPSGTVSGGTYTLTLGGATTAAIAYDADAATVLAALELLATVDAGDLVVTGGGLDSAAILITFVGRFRGSPQTAIVINPALITGGGTAAVTRSTSGIKSVKLGFFYEMKNADGLIAALNFPFNAI